MARTKLTEEMVEQAISLKADGLSNGDIICALGIHESNRGEGDATRIVLGVVAAPVQEKLPGFEGDAACSANKIRAGIASGFERFRHVSEHAKPSSSGHHSS